MVVHASIQIVSFILPRFRMSPVYNKMVKFYGLRKETQIQLFVSPNLTLRIFARSQVCIR